MDGGSRLHLGVEVGSGTWPSVICVEGQVRQLPASSASRHEICSLFKLEVRSGRQATLDAQRSLEAPERTLLLSPHKRLLAGWSARSRLGGGPTNRATGGDFMIMIKDIALVGAGVCVAVAAVAIYVANPAAIQAPQQNPTSTKAPQQLKQPTWDQERELATMYCAGSVRRLAQSREPYRSKSMDVEVEDTSIKWDSVSTKALAEIPSILLRGDLDRCGAGVTIVPVP